MFLRGQLRIFQTVLLFLVVLNCSWQINGKIETHPRFKRIVGGRPANPPPEDDAVVFTRAFGRVSRIEGFRNNRTGIYKFLGLYYADPPTGRNRYVRPIYKRLEGDITANQHGPPCLQPDPYNPRRIVGDENCLHLNIYTPKMPDESTGLPVFIWLHPGGFRFGSAAQYDATPMAQEGVIVVAPNYRLGSLGIIGDGTREFDGNLALFDMAVALRWVTEYIEYFGGDPKRITPIGQGSGAASAMYLSMSKSSRSASSVSSVVAMSGSALSQYALDKEPVQSVQDIAKINGCKTTNKLEIVKCLRDKPAEEIIQNDSKVQTERLAGRAIMESMGSGVTFQPHKEEEQDYRGLPNIIEYEAEEQIEKGKFDPIPLLTGTIKFETSNALNADKIRNGYQSVEQFLDSLTDSLKKSTSFLRINNSTIQLEEKLLSPVSNIFKLPKNLNINEVVSKLIDSTTDLVFNLPAVLTTQLWSKLAPAFMYRFEYNGTKSRGIDFLPNLPIVSSTDSANTMKPAHGDELGYLFNANDIFGKPLLETRLTDANDLKTRKNLISMLVNFVNYDKTKKNTGIFQSITGQATPYIKVDTSLQTFKDFPFCGLSVLGGSSDTCSGLSDVLAPATNVLNNLGGTLVNPIGGALGGLTNKLGSSGNKRDKNMSYDVLGLGLG